MKESRGKTWQIGVDIEHHGEREESCQKRKERRSENIRADSEKSSVNQRGARSVEQNGADRGEDPIGEGRQTTAAKYTELWKIMQRGPQQ